jgi:hypothetical protein
LQPILKILSCIAPNLTIACEQCVLTYSLFIILMFFIWSGNHKFCIQFLRLRGLQSLNDCSRRREFLCRLYRVIINFIITILYMLYRVIINFIITLYNLHKNSHLKLIQTVVKECGISMGSGI